jgi:hypothetical protein
MFSDAANRRYTFRTAAFMTAYAAVNSAAIGGAFDDLSGPGRWLFALAATAPIVGHVWATLALVREGDEFARQLTTKRFVFAWGLSLVVLCGWGFMESYAEAPHLPVWLAYPLFWLAFALVSPFVRTTQA